MTAAPARAPGVTTRPAARPWVWVVLTCALVLVTATSVAVGSRPVNPSLTWSVVSSPLTGADVPASLETAVVDARVWRTLAGVLTGAALAVAGALLQGSTRNPLGDPGILGLTAGAACAVVTGSTFAGLTGPGHQLWLSAAGSAVAMVLVYTMASLARGGARPVTLALTGAAVSAGLVALTSAVLLSHQATFDSFRSWQVGDLARPDASMLVPAVPVVLAGVLLALALAGGLDTLGLGDALSAGLGARPALVRSLAGLSVVLLAGTATALVGPLVFCGLMVPHAVRALVGVSYRRVLPACLLAGPLVVLLADVAARVLVPDREIQVGIALVLIGAPALVLVLRRHGTVSA